MRIAARKVDVDDVQDHERPDRDAADAVEHPCPATFPPAVGTHQTQVAHQDSVPGMTTIGRRPSRAASYPLGRVAMTVLAAPDDRVMLPQRPGASLRYPESSPTASVRYRRVREAPGVRSQAVARAGRSARPRVVGGKHAQEVRSQAEGYLAAGAGRVVIKAQVLVGGRGKAGGVKLAASADEAEAVGDAHPGHGYQGHHGAAGARGRRRGHRQGVLSRGGPRSDRPAHPDHGLCRGWRGDRAGRRDATPTPSSPCWHIPTSVSWTTRRARSRSPWAWVTAGRKPSPSSRACSRWPSTTTRTWSRSIPSPSCARWVPMAR